MTDSVVVHVTQLSNGQLWQTPVRGARKINWLRPARTAVVVSGMGDTDTLCNLRSEPEFRPAVTALFADVVAEEDRRWAKYSAANQAQGRSPKAPQLLAIGGHGRPEMACLTPLETRWADQSAMFAVGNWTWYWLEPRKLLETTPVPETLDGCEELAVSWARAMIADVYRGQTFEEIVAMGDVVGVAPPLNIVRFANGSIEEKVID